MTSGPAYKNTPEQQAVVDAAVDGQNIAVQACAGAGKTSTLIAVANAIGSRRSMLYLAYNTALAKEGEKKFPPGLVLSKTTHGLAYGPMCGYRGAVWPGQSPGNATGRRVADVLGLRPVTFETRTIPAPSLGYMVTATIAAWCHSADDRLGQRHFRLGKWADVLIPPEAAILRETVVPAAAELAERLLPERERGDKAYRGNQITDLPFTHDMYLKQYVRMVVAGRVAPPREQLIMVDEFQDSNALILQLVRHLASLGRQIIAVGDPFQQIYEWRGSVDALSQVEVDQRLRLRQSFRFGPETAHVANAWLRQSFGLEEDLVFGNPAKSTPVARSLRLPEATMILCRNNKSVAEHAVVLSDAGMTVLLPKGQDVAREIGDIETLRNGGTPSPNSDYAIFSSFDELMEHAESDDGKRIKTLLKLMDTHGAATLIDKMKAAGDAYRTGRKDGIVICTGHASKGLESARVLLDTDFNPRKSRKDRDDQEIEGSGMTDEDARILYVAMTRAQEINDLSRVEVLEPLIGHAAGVRPSPKAAAHGAAEPAASPPPAPKKKRPRAAPKKPKRGEAYPLPW